jgi:predicted RNA-binding Zn-ribbon protein involved in translation (DUF1610 family)
MSDTAPIEKWHLGLEDGRWVTWEGQFGHLPVQINETVAGQIVWTKVNYRHLESRPVDAMVRSCTLCVGDGDWECYGCGFRMASLTEGFNTKCPKCGSFELHLTDDARKRRA